MKDINFKIDPILTKRASDVIFDKIRSMIIDGELNPGDHLPSEQELIDMFQRSRPTVREALRMLENAGLIKTTPGNKGAVILEPSVASATESLSALMSFRKVTAIDLLEYREINDIAIAGWAAERRSESDIAELTKRMDKLEQSREDFNSFLVNVQKFLKTLTLCTHNSMVIIMDQIVKQTVPEVLQNLYLINPVDNRTVLIEHLYSFYLGLYHAIINQDSETAREIMKRHLQSAKADEMQQQTFIKEKTP